MIIVGADPGVTGAFAFYEVETRSIRDAFSMPTDVIAKGKGTRRDINWPMVVHMLRLATSSMSTDWPERVFVERVSSSPQMGVTSSFNFGRSFGGLEALIPALGWTAEYVTPKQWKKALKVPAEKDDAVHRASVLMPRDVQFWTVQKGLTKELASGRAEAAMIALYGYQLLAERGQLMPKPTRRRLAV